MKKRFFKFLSLLFLFVLIAFFVVNLGFVYAIPQLPMIVSGEVYINDKPAKIGTEITALVDGKEVEKTIIQREGRFELLLQGLETGQEVGFYVDGIYTNENIFYKDGDFKQLNLKVEKSYFSYYITILVILISGILIWKKKFYKSHKRKKGRGRR